MGYFNGISTENYRDVTLLRKVFNNQLAYNRKYFYPSMLSELIKEHGFQKTDLAKTIRINDAALSRATRLYFELGLEYIIKLFPDIFPISAHEFLFGEQGMVELPHYLQQVVVHIQKLSVEEREKILDMVTCERERRELLQGKYEPSYSEVLSSRIRELAADMYCADDEFLGEYGKGGMVASVRLSLNPTDEKKTKMGTVIYYALATGRAFDYFVRENYVPVVPIAYRVGTKILTVDDGTICKIISELLQMSPEARADAVASIFCRFI